MSEIQKASQENIDLFQEKFNQSQLSHVLSFTIMHNPKLKMNPAGLCGKVMKTPDIIKEAIRGEYSGVPDFVIILNEEVFDRLEYDQQQMVIEKILTQVRFDFEKDKLEIDAPDVQEFSGILRKYSFDSIEALNLHVESIYEQIADEPKEKKSRKKN